jgi:uncharacterized protein (DUF2147 family)
MKIRFISADRRRIFLRLSILSLLSLTAAAQAETSEDAIVGDWYTPRREAKIRIYRCESSFCGKIVWIQKQEETGEVIRDTNNPAEGLRDRPVLGIEIMREVRHQGGSVWSVGKLYDPKSGKSYKGKARLEGENKLVLRGYVLIPLFGRSETWIRADAQAGDH